MSRQGRGRRVFLNLAENSLPDARWFEANLAQGGKTNEVVDLTSSCELLDFEAVKIRGDQVRGACPVHGSTSTGSLTFSANITKNIYRCFKCQSQGNHLDLWAAVTNQELYDAAVDLCGKFHLEIPRIEATKSCTLTGEEEPVPEFANSNENSASLPPTPIDKPS